MDAARGILIARAPNQETTVSEDQLVITVNMDAARGILIARAPNQETTVSRESADLTITVSVDAGAQSGDNGE